MSEKNPLFDDNSILATPTPIFSSSIAGSARKFLDEMDELPQRLSDIEKTFGLISMRNSDIPSHVSSTNASKNLKHQRKQAMDTLNQYNGGFTSIPSRFLKPSEVTKYSVEFSLPSESTINESDLIHGNSSTPRSSILSNLEHARENRSSIGSLVMDFAGKVRNSEIDLSNIVNPFKKTVRVDGTFHSGEAAIERLLKDEMSWRREKAVPAQETDFSLSSQTKLSVGSFFQKRSDNPYVMLAESPDKTQPPVPLIEAASTLDDTINYQEQGRDSTISVSAIERVLQETNQTPHKAAEYFLNHKKNRDSASTISRTSRSSEKDLDFSASTDEGTKENVDCSVDSNRPKSILSKRSSSSLSSLPDGKLPIETTKAELIWGCIRPGKTSTTDFILRNRTSNRMSLKCSVSNPSFRIIEGSELNFLSTLKITLHPYESRKLMIAFSPTTMGAAVDQLTFVPADPNLKQSKKQFLRLCGYGGYGNVVFDDIVKDTTGKYILSLGTIGVKDIMKKTFTIRNRGNLACFVHMHFTSGVPSVFSSITITPQSLILLPDKEASVTIEYTPQKRSIQYINSNLTNGVAEMGKLFVTTGTEADRNRLRRICQKAQEKHMEIRDDILKLIEIFPGEAIPSDVKCFKESVQALEEIVNFFNKKEIAVTLEQDLDATLEPDMADETQDFHSLYEHSHWNTECTTQIESCQVEPSKIILTSDKMTDMIFITNFTKNTVNFKVSSSPKGIIFMPEEGTITLGNTCSVSLTCRPSDTQSLYKVKVFIDDESFDVTVKVLSNISKLY